MVVRPKIFTRIDLILKRIPTFDFEEWIELIACFFFLKEIDTKQETRVREIDGICSRNLEKRSGLFIRRLDKERGK